MWCRPWLWMRLDDAMGPMDTVGSWLELPSCDGLLRCDLHEALDHVLLSWHRLALDVAQGVVSVCDVRQPVNAVHLDGVSDRLLALGLYDSPVEGLVVVELDLFFLEHTVLATLDRRVEGPVEEASLTIDRRRTRRRWGRSWGCGRRGRLFCARRRLDLRSWWCLWWNNNIDWLFLLDSLNDWRLSRLHRMHNWCLSLDVTE